ncbi:uncharacterized protein LAESUDRAFT_743005 [Laetiporus sulphureus 93-53]|uniref:Mediator of RNA polymerase II transcription subunit 4 n=1 Tax=Laetiporus sulphureus 93-53 TaxID=1314785 RepID=A0A165EKU2_9APHY|nr:uncharacterized protein LAESUDRAFT_743005 [Laetiporus sulphureus 93-53]KZT07268.1 hypothetical protein LAESUDRAFT_743005 [Laetiporus sulphureus 93-53]
MSAILLEPLEHLSSLSQQLFRSLGLPASKPPPPPFPPASALLAADAALADAVQRARAHQVRQRRIEALKEEVLALERRWRAIVSELEEGRRELEEVVREGEVRTKAIEEAKAAAVLYPELLTYAHKISSFTSAPPNMPEPSMPGQPPPPLFFPPFPNEEKMRRGRMNDEEPLGLLGETHSVGKPPTVQPKSVEMPPHLAGPGAHPYRPELRHPQQEFFDFDLDLNPDL